MKIKDPLIELLAIKLHEHDRQDGKWPGIRPGWESPSWMSIAEEDREIYREIARGNKPIGD